MTNNNSTQSETQMAEAPASWNTRYISPEGFECQLTLRAESGSELLEKVNGAIEGFECQLTLRAESGSELLEKVNGAIGYLLANDCIPYTYNRGGYRGPVNNKSKVAKGGNNSGENQFDDPAWCPIHQCEMKRWEKDGRLWYSHKVDDDWCKGK